jgi:hypothetical protein
VDHRRRGGGRDRGRRDHRKLRQQEHWQFCSLGRTPTATAPANSPAQQPAAQPTTTTVAPAPPPAPVQDTIVYTITGGHAGNITYIQPGESFQESQITDRTKLPWSKTWTLDPSGYEQFGLTIEAQNSGGGTIGCSITVDGKVIAQNSSSGEYAVVTCSP